MTGDSKAKKYKLLDEISVRVLTVNHFQNNYKLMFHIHDVSALKMQWLAAELQRLVKNWLPTISTINKYF